MKSGGPIESNGRVPTKDPSKVKSVIEQLSITPRVWELKITYFGGERAWLI